jgi:hypothetical protein
MLNTETYSNERGGNVAYKALAHPVAAEGLARIADTLNRSGRVAIYDPNGIADTLLALTPAFDVEGIYVHDSLAVGLHRGVHPVRALTELPATGVRTVLIAAFDANRLVSRMSSFVRSDAAVVTLDDAKLPPHMVTNRTRYLDAINFATNFAFFRDCAGLGTRLTTINYWESYGARSVSIFMRLYDASGKVLAQWQQDVPDRAGGISIDSGEIRRRFDLPPFIGQLFVHVVGIAGHDVVKYALDTYATNGGDTLSCTHDANAWPAERYAGLPAPVPDEQVVLWIQNSHAQAIPAGELALDCMGAESPISIDTEVPAFATLPVDISSLLPNARWPTQIEFRAGRHVVRPRYEVTRSGRARIAHLNVEREDLRPDAGIKALIPALGRGYILPFPILPRGRYRTLMLPTPMSVHSTAFPLRVDIFAEDGRRVSERFLGVLPRNHGKALDFDELLNPDELADGGHAELVYDFRNGGDADGWLHALFRYEERNSGHVAESSFGAHMFNTLMTYRNEPQSYNGPPPGLSTKLFLTLGNGNLEKFCVLIYPASAPWRPRSRTTLQLYRDTGEAIASKQLAIACSGSRLLYLAREFEPRLLHDARAGGYVLIKDDTCRLFGYHGLDDRRGRFSFDHMFGF